MSTKYFFRVRHAEGSFDVPCKPCGFSTVAYEEAIMTLPGSFDRWKIDHDFTKSPGTVVYRDLETNKCAIGHLYCNGVKVADFDEEDKPHGSNFTVFTGGEPIPCDSVASVAKAVANAIFDMHRCHCHIRAAS